MTRMLSKRVVACIVCRYNEPVSPFLKPITFLQLCVIYIRNSLSDVLSPTFSRGRAKHYSSPHRSQPITRDALKRFTPKFRRNSRLICPDERWMKANPWREVSARCNGWKQFVACPTTEIDETAQTLIFGENNLVHSFMNILFFFAYTIYMLQLQNW